MDLPSLIQEAYQTPALLHRKPYADALAQTLEELTQGKIRCAVPPTWEVQTWVKQAILLYFRSQNVRPIRAGDLFFWDKIPVQNFGKDTHVRVVPPALVRYGAYVAPNTILMPSFVNIGAYVDEGTLVDTWATVGSCAQIGKGVHLSGGVGIGGVLEPPQAKPVIIEDHAFIGSRSILVEGVHVGREAIIGAGVILTASMPIIDTTTAEEKVYKGYVPPRAVVISGMRPKTLAAGTYYLPAALIIGWRQESHEPKVSLNAALRTWDIPV
ncbi:MAG: 2,3,4,5-tetrahydropyridine-2,6-dicarboxylate N-succinyltransferase [Bacteroidia bacterium]